ncbi:OLC1v1009973C1 [Oldenlandia corymbosa var. corymbosa]|uniref:OLC1v1009973C1 n=1 Tax=Oldenlandia corymbosa var. corymbosa TaxID=529605 RepID=A0AAV1DQ82_OLDCO|nr:OLC1v1009973C1 [Oldenlandia corymbosa var. corymbosa]
MYEIAPSPPLYKPNLFLYTESLNSELDNLVFRAFDPRVRMAAVSQSLANTDVELRWQEQRTAGKSELRNIATNQTFWDEINTQFKTLVVAVYQLTNNKQGDPHDQSLQFGHFRSENSQFLVTPAGTPSMNLDGDRVFQMPLQPTVSTRPALESSEFVIPFADDYVRAPQDFGEEYDVVDWLTVNFSPSLLMNVEVNTEGNTEKSGDDVSSENEVLGFELERDIGSATISSQKKTDDDDDDSMVTHELLNCVDGCDVSLKSLVDELVEMNVTSANLMKEPVELCGEEVANVKLINDFVVLNKIYSDVVRDNWNDNPELSKDMLVNFVDSKDFDDEVTNSNNEDVLEGLSFWNTLIVVFNSSTYLEDKIDFKHKGVVVKVPLHALEITECILAVIVINLVSVYVSSIAECIASVELDPVSMGKLNVWVYDPGINTKYKVELRKKNGKAVDSESEQPEEELQRSPRDKVILERRSEPSSSRSSPKNVKCSKCKGIGHEGTVCKVALKKPPLVERKIWQKSEVKQEKSKQQEVSSDPEKENITEPAHTSMQQAAQVPVQQDKDCGKINKILSMVYGDYQATGRNDMQQNLIDIAATCQVPWLVSGDFNSVLQEDEKLRDITALSQDTDMFKYVVEQCKLEGMKTIGGKFTWNNKMLGKDRIVARLDKSLINEAWLDQYEQSYTVVKQAGISDHNSLVIRMQHEEHKKKKAFKYFNMWQNNPHFKEMIAEQWKQEVIGTRQYQVAKKQQLVKGELKKLNRREYADIEQQEAETKEKMESVQKQLDGTPDDLELQREEKEAVEHYIIKSISEEMEGKLQQQMEFEIAEGTQENNGKNKK